MSDSTSLDQELNQWHREIYQAQEDGDRAVEYQKLEELKTILAADRLINPVMYHLLSHITERYRYQKISSGLSDQVKKPHIVFVTPEQHVLISRHLIENSIGTSGSEEILLRTADELASFGFEVTILSNVANFTHDTLPHCNPRFHPVSQIEVFSAWNRKIPKLTFAHRDTRFELLKEYVKGRLVYWPWDWPGKITISPKLDNILCVSSHVRQALSDANLDPELQLLFASDNSYHAPIIPESFKTLHQQTFLDDNRRNSRRCVFVSGHHRGLSYLIKIWLRIVEKYPDARLDVYFGRHTFINYEWPGWSKEEQEETYRIIDTHPSIRDLGRISHEELNQVFSQSGFMLLPSNFPETLCITAIKAQYFGCIPLVSSAVAREVIYEEIPIIHLDNPVTEQFLDNYYQLVVDYLANPELEELRVAMSHSTYQKYSSVKNTQRIIESFMV